MQIKIAGTPAAPFNLGGLQNAFKATSCGGSGVFESGQHPIIVGQNAYNSALGYFFHWQRRPRTDLRHFAQLPQ